MHRLMAFLPLFALACNGDTGGDEGPFTVTVSIPDSYFAASTHQGADFSLAVVYEGAVEDEVSGTLPTTQGAPDDVDLTVAAGDEYEVDFWVDSNLGGGTAGTCDGDPDFFDHQWVYTLGTVDEDRTFDLPAHNTDFTDVCAAFE